MSLDDTQSSAEIIVNSVIHDVCCKLDNEQSPSTDYESIHSSKLVLLVRICHYKEEPVGPELFTQNKIRELRNSTKSHYDPFDIEVMSEYEACLTFKREVTLGMVAGELMPIEDWMGVPVVITVLILGRNKIGAILEAHERHQQTVRRKEVEDGGNLRVRDRELQEEKVKLEQEIQDYSGKQRNLEKIVEGLSEKIQKMGTQPISGKGFSTSSTQNLSGSFGNLTTSFQVKADLDIGKFSGTEPVPDSELTFDQWRIDVRSYQTSVPDHILLPAVRKSIVGKAQSVVRTLGPNYSVEDIIKCLVREYEGVASSNIVFKEFYQLKQERGVKVQIFSIRLRDALTNLTSRFPERVPAKDHDKMLRDRFFYGIKAKMRNSIRHLYDDDKVMFGELLMKVRRNEDEEVLAKVISKSVLVDTEIKDGLEEKVDKLLAVAKLSQYSIEKGKRDSSQTPKQTPTNSRQNTPTKRDRDMRNNLKEPEANASGPFPEGLRPIQCFKCKGWGHPQRLCCSCLNYTRGGITREPPSPAKNETARPHPQNPNS